MSDPKVNTALLSTFNPEEYMEKEEQSDRGITLELGDIIEIHAPSNHQIHSETFFITYLDEEKLKLTNIATFHPYTLKLDEEGRITDESVHQIVLLSRSEEQGYARQHLLMPKTWVDIHFGGEIPTIITGEITNLEEDMIEITTYPDVETIYIDFAYKGIPEDIPLEQIVIRTKPASLEKIASMIDVREQLEEEGDDTAFAEREAEKDDVSMEWTATGEAVLQLPENTRPDASIRDTLHGMYLSANEIVYAEELEDLVQRVEIPEHQKRFGIETQVNDMLDELLSEVPSSRRTKAVLDNIHRLIERFRELRSRFSTFDAANGSAKGAKLLGARHKPLVDAMQTMKTKLQWLMPVVALRRKIYTAVHPETISDVIQLNQADVLAKDQMDQEDYTKHRMRSDVPAYKMYYEKIASSATPIEPPLFSDEFLAPRVEIDAAFDAVVQNLENFYSTVLTSAKDVDAYARRRFIIQRYQLGETMMQPSISAQSGRRVYTREPLTPTDTATIGSMLVLPVSTVEYSKISLPGTMLIQRAGLARHPLALFRLLQQKTDVQSHVISDFDKDMDAENWTQPEKEGVWRRKVQEFALDNETVEQSPGRFRDFLETMVPKTTTLIEILAKQHPTRLSLKRMIDTLEPFLVYVEDLNYSQYNAVRFFVKTNIREYRKLLASRGQQLGALRSMQYADAAINASGLQGYNSMEQLFFEKRELFELLVDAYHLREQKKGSHDVMPRTPSEWMAAILLADDACLISDLLQYMMVSLVTPEDLLQAMAPALRDGEDMTRIDKIKAGDCQRRVLTKKYTSVQALQKDNGEREIYYDTDFDDSPYHLLQKYKDDQKKYSPEQFADFFKEALVQKHDCPTNMVEEMATTLIAGKKMVREGEFAMLEIVPTLPGSEDEAQLTQKEKREINQEMDVRKKIQYFRRVRNQWIHDESIDETVFIDNNTLFCNMDKICFRDVKANRCEPAKDAETRMKQIAHKKMVSEFDERFANSVETLRDDLKQRVVEKMRVLQKSHTLRDIQRNKASILAFELGRYAKTDEIAQSPHVVLRDQILGQDDFVKQQSDIVRFVNLYCRDPMVAELGDMAHWLYCKETNLPLFPAVLFELARTFTSGDNYSQKQAELCRKQGILSDDGDSIVDRYSGYVIRKIDFVEEQGYDEAGFRVLTSGVMEKDAGAAFIEVAGSGSGSGSGATKQKDRVFENETNETVYNLFSAISKNISIPADAIEDFVIRTSVELIEKNVKSEAAYKEDVEKAKEKRLPPYSVYRNKFILLIVAAVILVGIQTAVPSFKVRRTFPGCVQSFSGYPSNEGGAIEDMTGIRYLACVLHKMKSPIAPWDAIQRLPLDMIQAQMRQIVEKIIVPRSDIMELYLAKREYLLLHPEEDIPKEHAIQKWTGCLPPVVEYTVIKSLRGLSNDYRQELLTMFGKGDREQRNQINMFKTKSILYGYGVIEAIRNVVRSKNLLLKTASNMFFTENACCNDRNTSTILEYFETEDATLLAHIRMVEGWEVVLQNVRELSRAPMLFDPRRTGLVMHPMPLEHTDETIYAAFIWYCNLDRDAPIPDEMQALFPEKIVDYNPKASLPEKIEFFKQNGKRFTVTHLTQLMEIVHRQNVVHVEAAATRQNTVPVLALREFLEYMDTQDQTVLEKPLRERIEAVLTNYNPRVMVVEDSEETRRLNNYLGRANVEMLGVISDFFQAHGNLSSRKFEQLQEMMANIHMWNLDPNQDDAGAPTTADETAMYTVIQFMQTSTYNMSRIYPEMLRNNHATNTKAAAHWGVSQQHQLDIARFLAKYYKPLQKFKHDPILMHLLVEVQRRLVDLNVFLSHIPCFTPIHRGAEGELPARTYYSLFDKRTIYMLHTYIWYSVLYEYVTATDDVDLLQMDVQERKEMRREIIRENADEMAPGISEEMFDDLDERDDYALDRSEIQITVGNQKDLKRRVAEMLLAFLEIDGDDKNSLDLSYTMVQERVSRSKQAEKNEITSFFENMDKDERRVEDTKKAMKLGRWSVGLQKGLVKYDKDTYDRERRDILIEELVSRTGQEDEMNDPVMRDADDLAREQDEVADHEGDLEALDIRGLGENYGDGEYYEEDMEGDDFGYDV